MTIKELNRLFSSKLPKGRSGKEIKAAAEVRTEAKALAMTILRNTPKGSDQDALIVGLKNAVEPVYALLDIWPIRKV